MNVENTSPIEEHKTTMEITVKENDELRRL
jgi:hypothetical protein